MKVKLNIFVGLFLCVSTLNAQDFGIGGSYVFVEDLDDVYGVVGHLHLPITETVFVALRGASYQDVERRSSVGPLSIDISADYYP